ncbi:MAG: hypothetical protein ABI315_06210 [Bacteroidia bacterium]
MKKYYKYIVSILLLFSSCEEEIKLELAGGAKKIVIEGNIENGKVAEVIITRNSPLSQVIDFSSILIKNAKVYVSDGIITDTLHLDTLLTTSIPFVYTGSKIKGKVGVMYQLTVIVDADTYTASTVIPSPIALDSVWWKPQPPEDTLGYAWGHLTDPKGLGNAYRWFAKRPLKTRIMNGQIVILNRRYLAPIGSTFDDKFIDGKSFDIFYNRSYDPTETLISENESQNERNLYKKSDTIYIKFCTINNETAKFYTTYEAAISSNGNPFASPSTIIGNLQGGALGIWAGYGATYDTIMPRP